VEHGHVFVSYARRDHGYVTGLVAFLRESGLDVWVDGEIPNGTRWDRVLKQKIDTCVVVVLVMSPAAGNSDWVAEEVRYARSLGKPVLPLLLEGEILFGLGIFQHEDVTGARLPRPAFLRRQRDLVNHGLVNHGPNLSPVDDASRTPGRASGVRQLVGVVVPNSADCF